MNLSLILILLGVTTFIGGISIAVSLLEKYNKNIPDVLGTFLVIIWGILIVSLSTFKHYKYEESILQVVERHEYWIQSLGNDKYMEGDIGLFSGTINETDYYFFYVNYTKGMFREKLETYKCYIIEGDYKPEVKGVYRTYKDEDRFWKLWDECEPEYYRIYVPKGTIIREFKVR